jgi:hypothetical protein
MIGLCYRRRQHKNKEKQGSAAAKQGTPTAALISPPDAKAEGDTPN